MSNFPTKQAIEKLAYEIYVARGRQDGQEVEDWVKAEKQLIEQYWSLIPATGETDLIRAGGETLNVRGSKSLARSRQKSPGAPKKKL